MTATLAPLAPLEDILATIDVLLGRLVALATEQARLKARIDDLHVERKLREAQTALTIEGKNAEERAARLTIALAADGDYRRLIEDDRSTRLRLTELEASAWSTKFKLRVCLTLLKLAAETEEDSADGDGEGEPDGAGA